MNPLNTIQGTIIAGIVLAIVVALVVMGVQVNELSLIVWIHVMAGITWIGMLYYFNFVQTPYFATDLGGQARSAMMRLSGRASMKRSPAFFFGGSQGSSTNTRPAPAISSHTSPALQR